MDRLVSWWFVNLVAAVSGLAAFWLLPVAAKVSLDPYPTVLYLPMLIAASVWLALALLRRILPFKSGE